MAAILSQQAAALEATGVGSLVNSMWLNGAQVPDHSRLVTQQAKMGYGVQVEMQKLQVGPEHPPPQTSSQYPIPVAYFERLRCERSSCASIPRASAKEGFQKRASCGSQ